MKKQVNQHIFEKKCQREHRREHQKKCQRKPSVFIRTALSFLLASLMLFSLMACTTNGGSNQEKPAQPGVDPPSGPRIVVDMAGRSVELPDEVKAVAHTYGLAGNVLFAFGAGEMIVGMSGANDLSRLLYPGIVDVPSIGRNQVDLELLASIGPDIYIGRASNVNDLEAVQALGIPAIGISAENLDDIAVLYTLMGQILDQEEKAAELIAYYHSIYDKATELVSSVPDSQRKTAIVMGNNIATVAHEGMIQSEMIVAAGGISCVVGSDVPSNQGTWPAAGTETIFAWNPDFIFLTNTPSASYTAEDILGDPAWSGLKAVKNGNVYTIPSKLDSWEFPGLPTSLGTLWLTSKMYPNLISEAEVDKIVVEYYKKIYGIDATPELLGY